MNGIRQRLFDWTTGRTPILALGAALATLPGLAAAEALHHGQQLFEQQLGAPVAAEALDEQRGLADTFRYQTSTISEQGTVLGNVVESSPSGMNVIHDGALRDNHGLTTVIQNSGHHVIIQEATNINVTVTP
ncbi:hypothetical protein [Halorhodospira halophila]|uniref:Uncharacterized protein n=1 Tax=Halorhodospira halophila (strain DSM 244 / SL1) TaxID=349124 RepID=A1WV06_HALHL|nr:hypothetical protein [Halorhodospira halophila]ABM61518.1 hypothetical protein Hhal_0737 [Halorhodospira halophila SL1]MBK1728767.1 hypothetical protein [Halorhodospira halophila]